MIGPMIFDSVNVAKYFHCLFTVTVSDMKSRSAHACVCVCVCVCVCAWSGWFLLQSPEMKLNSSQVKIKYDFSKSFRSKPFSKDGNHAESEQFL